MAAIKASVNVFALLDGDDPGDKRLSDFDPQHKDQPKKKPLSAAACAYKLKLMKPPSPAAPGAGSNGSQEEPYTQGRCRSPVGRSGAQEEHFTGSRCRSPACGNGAHARSMNKQTSIPAPPPPARNTNLTGVLFAYPSARERIFKQRKERQEEFERRQAKVRQEEYERQQTKVKGGSISGDGNKSAGAGAPTADKRKGKTHGVRVKQDGGGYHYGGGKQQPVVTVKEAPAPAAKEPVVAPVVLQTPPPPPSVDDIVQFPSLSLK